MTCKQIVINTKASGKWVGIQINNRIRNSGKLRKEGNIKLHMLSDITFIYV